MSAKRKRLSNSLLVSCQGCGDTKPYNPSILLSMKEALPLLVALQGNGISAEKANRSGWKGAFGDVTDDSGLSPGALISMCYKMQGYIAPSWDFIGVINVTSPDEVSVVGNHCDSWVTGGAADPNFARAFGKLLAKGWKPRRTICVFHCSVIARLLIRWVASWNTEEFSLQGFTE